jgi:hypothetical protein
MTRDDTGSDRRALRMAAVGALLATTSAIGDAAAVGRAEDRERTLPGISALSFVEPAEGTRPRASSPWRLAAGAPDRVFAPDGAFAPYDGRHEPVAAHPVVVLPQRPARHEHAAAAPEPAAARARDPEPVAAPAPAPARPPEPAPARAAVPSLTTAAVPIPVPARPVPPERSPAAAVQAPPRVFVHFSTQAPDGARRAAETARFLAERGHGVADIRQVAYAVGTPRVRFFFARDRAPAEVVAEDVGAWLAAAGRDGAAGEQAAVVVQDFTGYPAPPSPGNIEVWLASVAAAGRM